MSLSHVSHLTKLVHCNYSCLVSIQKEKRYIVGQFKSKEATGLNTLKVLAHYYKDECSFQVLIRCEFELLKCFDEYNLTFWVIQYISTPVSLYNVFERYEYLYYVLYRYIILVHCIKRQKFLSALFLADRTLTRACALFSNRHASTSPVILTILLNSDIICTIS